MEYERFLNEVMQKAHLQTTGEAMGVIRAVIETLGERLGNIEQKDLRAQLPRQMKGWIHQRANGESFPLDQFYSRVGRRADLTDDEAILGTHIVLGLVREAISDGQMQDLLEILPDDYRRAFMEEPPVAPATRQAAQRPEAE